MGDKAIDTSKSPAENAKGIVDQAKDFAGDILTGIAEWVVGKVADELAIMAAAAAASGGLSEVLDVLRRVYKAILTAVRWARRVLDMVNQVLDTVLDIAGGAVEKVGAKFEKIMHRGMPVVIGFLADQVGLGGVGTAIRDIVDKLREKVDAAILWLIDKIKAGIEAVIGAVKSGAAAILDWWREKRNFVGLDGKPHTVSVEGGEASPSIVVATTPKKVRPYLEEITTDPSVDVTVKTVANDALVLYNTKLAPVTAKTAPQPLIEAFPSNLSALSKLLMQIVGAQQGDLPQKASWDCQAPAHSRVELLSTRTSTGGGEPGGSKPKGWEVLQAVGLTKLKGDWKRMHMITAGIGGAGAPNNLVPAPTSVNSGAAVRGFERSVETLVKKENSRTKKPSVIWVEVKVTSYHPADSDPVRNISYDSTTFAESVSFAAGLHFPDESKQWTKDETPQIAAQTPVPKPDLEGLPVDLNTVGRLYIERTTGVSKYFAQEIAALAAPGRWSSYTAFKKDIIDQRKAGQRPTDTDEFLQSLAQVKAAEVANKIRFGD